MKIHILFPLVAGILSFASAHPIGQRGEQQPPTLAQPQISLSDDR